jgi:hypothetical protein
MGSQVNEELLEQIRRLERELFLKKSQLAAAKRGEPVFSTLLGEGLDPANWQKIFRELREKVGMFSKGGSSVEDVHRERDR